MPLWLEVGRRSFSFQGTFINFSGGLYRLKINFVNYQFDVFFTLHFFLARCLEHFKEESVSSHFAKK